MKYIIYTIDFNNSKLSEYIRYDIQGALEVFYDNDPIDRFGYIDNDSDVDCVHNRQGWMASVDDVDNPTISVILLKDEPGIFEHYLKYAYRVEDVKRIICRKRNLENLLD